MSQRARFDATAVVASAVASVDVQAVQAVMQRRQITVEAFAINAECSRSQVSGALSGAENRNLAFAWVLAQERHEPGFVKDVFDEVDRRLGITPVAQRAESFEFLVELLRQIWFRERRDDRKEQLA